MANDRVRAALENEAKIVLGSFRDGSLDFLQYESGLEIPYRVDFEEWIAYLDQYLDVRPEELEGELRFLTVKRFFSTIENNRLKHLMLDPKSITEDESLEWRKKLYENDGDYANFLILVPLELPSGEIGSAIIRDYSDIPGGEYSLVDVFLSLEDGRRYLSKYTL
jgi:hypothetical protein